MFSKPLSLILVYVVTIFNMMILTSPLLAAITPFLRFENDVIVIPDILYRKMQFSFLLLAFLVSLFMLLYLILDFLFGFSLSTALKGCKRYEKLKEYDFLTGIFDQVKDKFGEKYVRLYIKESEEINAYALSSMSSKAIVLTTGLINNYIKLSRDSKEFLYSLRSVMGHEMSHLVNKDFLPSFLIISNQKVTNFTSSILFFAFKMTARIISSTPYVGHYMARSMDNVYSILNLIITFFNRFVVYNLYEFLRRFISRSIEFRCDMQSAQAFGGRSMATALSMLGESGYFTLFSTHPRTKIRMKKVENVKISDSIIKPRFIDSLANYLSILFLMIICLCFAKLAHIDLMVREYIRDHEIIHRKISALWHLILNLF